MGRQLDRQTDTQVGGCGFHIMCFFFLLHKESLKNSVPYIYVVVAVCLSFELIIYLYLFASVLSHLVSTDLSRFVQVKYSLINNEHKLDTLTNTT